jgi:hypothetical protein
MPHRDGVIRAVAGTGDSDAGRVSFGFGQLLPFGEVVVERLAVDLGDTEVL